MPASSPPFSAQLHALAEQIARQPLTLHELVHRLGLRSHTLALTLLALPFLTPIPLPGLSTPFGVAIGLIALQMARGREPRLPRRMAERTIPAGFFSRVFRGCARLLGWLERFLRPRWLALTATNRLRSLHALTMALAGGALLLPLPIPLTNSFPALVVVLMATGLEERDGRCIVLAYGVFFAGLGYLALVGSLLTQFSHWLGF